MNKEDLQRKFQMFEQQIIQIQQQLEAIDHAIAELTGLKVGLDDLKGNTGKEIMSPIGRGIFVKATLISEKILVDVGGKNFVEKEIDETKELIQEQLGKLKEAKIELENELKKIDKELTDSMLAGEGCGCGHDHGHACGEECDDCEDDECEDDCSCDDEEKECSCEECGCGKK